MDAKNYPPPAKCFAGNSAGNSAGNGAGCVASRASFNNHLGVPMTLAMLPDAPLPAIQEMGMNAPGEISQLSQMARPDVAVITCIADSHAGFFDSLADIAAAKGEIFDGMASGGTAILNRDDAFFAKVLRTPLRHSRCRRKYCSA